MKITDLAYSEGATAILSFELENGHGTMSEDFEYRKQLTPEQLSLYKIANYCKYWTGTPNYSKFKEVLDWNKKI